MRVTMINEHRSRLVAVAMALALCATPVAAQAEESTDAAVTEPEAIVQTNDETAEDDNSTVGDTVEIEPMEQGTSAPEDASKSAVTAEGDDAVPAVEPAADGSAAKDEAIGQEPASEDVEPATDDASLTDAIWTSEDADSTEPAVEPTTGWVKEGLTWRYLDDAGAAKTGWFDWEGHWYLFDGSGQMLTGWQEVSGARYYLYASGVLAQGDWVTGTDQSTYLGDSGAPASGLTETPRGTYYLNNGVGDGSQRQRLIENKIYDVASNGYATTKGGLHILDGSLYRTTADGTVQPSVTGSSNAALDSIITKIILEQTGIGSDAGKKAYDYVRLKFGYVHMNTWPSEDWQSWSPGYAIEMYNNGQGNCYRYASLVTWTLRALGYDCKVRVGWVPAYSGKSPHGWCEVTLADGSKRVVDCSLASNHAYPKINGYMVTYKGARFAYYDYNNVKISTYA